MIVIINQIDTAILLLPVSNVNNSKYLIIKYYVIQIIE